MKNILFVGATRNFLNEKIINKTLKEELADKAVLLVHEKSDAYIFEPLGRCIYREDAAKGNYAETDIDMSSCIPLDDIVFSHMAPHIFEILNQQRRFEEYHAFHISGSYETHYMIYMHNLFFWNNLLEKEQITHVFLRACRMRDMTVLSII